MLSFIRMKRRIILLAAAVILIGVGGFFVWRGTNEIIAPTGLRVVTTFEPMYVFTANVVGNLGTVENLLPQGVGPHDYTLQPSDAIKVSKANVVVKQGRGIDDWLDTVIAATGSKQVRVITAGEGIEPHTGAPILNLDGVAVAPPIDSSLVKPDANDPHIWNDPFLVIQEVENIRDGFMSYDPVHADAYARNAESYILKLLMLDLDIRGQLAEIKTRDFVTFHSAFRYFAYEYGLREVATIEEVAGKEPSPAELARIVDEVKSKNVKVIFSEPQFSPKIVETLVRDYGLQLVQLDPLETGELHPDYYEEIVRKNVKALVDAFNAN